MFDETTDTTEETESPKINPICVVAGSAIATYAGYRIWKAIRNKRWQRMNEEDDARREQMRSEVRKSAGEES